ncbi:GNAT family N-acetyltransferase [Rossellomorea aquimaris]|uniref:GNAT family N-acetyltransferase n=1 Tax=Rossellomorea aquimaris TaxID=189382 RepID=UPI0007D08C2E|nr:GNAT family N-acetyltransferase [Rossellomorea aquimaris]
MELKLLQEQDAESYWELRLEMLQQNPEAFGSSYEEALEREDPIQRVAKNLTRQGSYTFGYLDEKKLIGTVTLVIENGLKTQHKASLFAMYVTPSIRGKGIARKLVRAAIQKAESIDEIEQVMLTVVTTNLTAKALYQSFGFNTYGTEKRALKYKGEYFDEDLMVLFL